MQAGLGQDCQNSTSQTATINAPEGVNGVSKSNEPNRERTNTPANHPKYSKTTQYFAAVTATENFVILVMIGGLISGSWVSWTSPAYDAMVSSGTEAIGSSSQNWEFSITQSQFDIIAAIYPLGGAIVCLPLGFLMDTFGRKRTMLALAFPSIVGWILIITAQDVYMLYAGRFLGGIAGGGFCICAPQYACEIAHKNIRGALASCYSLLNVIGVVFCYVVGPYCGVPIVSACLLVVSIVFAVLLLFQPETPFYYIKKGQFEEAKNVLEYFRGKNYDVSLELKELMDRDKWLQDRQVTAWESLKQRPAQRAIGVALGLQIYQQCSGIDVILAFQQDIFTRANLPMSPQIATIIAGSMQILFTCVSVKCVDRLGRRFLLMTSGLIIALCCAVLSMYLSLSSSVANQVSFLPVLSLCVYRAVYALGCGPVPWIMAAEIVPSEMKSVIGPLTGSFSWLLTILVVLFFYKINAWVGMNVTFAAFAVMTYLNCLWIYFWIPETKCRSAEEIREILEGRKKSQAKLEVFRLKENTG